MVPPNTTCVWTIEPVNNAHSIELVLVREHLAALDLMAIFLGSDSGMVSTSVGYKAANWTMLVTVRLPTPGRCQNAKLLYLLHVAPHMEVIWS